MLDKYSFLNKFADLVEEKYADRDLTITRNHLDFKMEFKHKTLDGVGSFRLVNAYDAYKNSPEEEDKIINFYVDCVKDFLDFADNPDKRTNFSDFKDKIYPFVKAKRSFDDKSLEYLQVFKDLTPELFVTCVVDSENSMRMLTKHDLEKWDIEPNELYEIAMQNFKRDKDAPMVSDTTNGNTIHVYQNGDSYDATRVLLSHRIQEVVDSYNGKCLIGMPFRDVLVIFPTSPKRIRNACMLKVAMDNQQQQYPLSPYSYSYHKGELLKELK